MRQPSFGRRLGALLAGGALLGAWAPALYAQGQAVITGRVTSDKGETLGGATVIVNSTNFGAATNPTGVYSITIGASSVRGQTVTLTARALGFRPASREVTLTAGTQEQNFTLAADPLRLDELVVTGVSEATSTKLLTFSVGRASEAELQIAPAITALGALQGKVAGVSIQQNSGQPGQAPQIKLRGSTSITGSQDPLIIVDGTITRFSLADIASEDIERVEVIKGAAAASLYGSDAANGVIQVFTKRGKNLAEGKLAVTSRFEGGSSFVTKDYPVTQHHAYILDPSTPDGFFRRADGNRVLPSQCKTSDNVPGGCPAPVDIQQNLYPPTVICRDAPCLTKADSIAAPKQLLNNQDELLNPGIFLTQYVAVGQNRGRTNFNASFQNTWNEGSVFSVNGFRRQNYRVNLDQVLNDRIDLSLQSFFGRSVNSEPTGNGSGTDTPFFGIAFIEPHVDVKGCCNPDGSPFKAFVKDKRSNAANPLYLINSVKDKAERNRFSGGGRIRWRPQNWLSVEGNYNYDNLSADQSVSEPVTFFSGSGGSRPGGLSMRSDNLRTYNLGGTVTGIWRVNGAGLFKNLGITTKGAVVYEDQINRRLSASATSFIVKNVPEFPGTDPANQRAGSFTQNIRNRNFFGITTLTFNDKVILDGLVRRDGSSLFGPDARWKTYYRASGAIRVPQLLGWTGGPEELRVHGSYGTAGLRPGFTAQFEVLTPSAGAFVKSQLGNRLLKPAQSREVEVGGNLELADGRFTLEYNYSDKNTTDQIINAPLLAVSGFSSQWQNIGSLKSKTHEVALGIQAINTRDVALQLNFTGDRTRETITSWPLPDDIFSTLGGFSPFTFTEGVKLGQMRGQRWIRNIEDLYLDPAKAALQGAGQFWSRDSVTVNADGYVVRKSVRGKNNELPIERRECTATDASGACTATTNIFSFGVSQPDFRIGLNTTFAFRRFSVTSVWDWSKGGEIYNGTSHWGAQDCADNRCDQFNKAPEDRIAETFYQTGLYNGAKPNDAFVESATWVKLRELSVNYTFTKSQLDKVGLGRLVSELRIGGIGRNLFTFTDYRGLDPDVAPVGEDGFKVRGDWFQYPPFRTFTGFVEIAF